jgi:acetolactate synthase-1/2/3 large subunit
MKLSDYVIDFIVASGVSQIFEMPGGATTHLLDSIYGRTDIECVTMHHEQAASFAAEAYARVNGVLGVAMATSGPGALNMVTGIGSCYFDSVPCLFITGQVNTYEYKFERMQRQIGFQETDIVSVVKPLTKFAEIVVDAGQIRYLLEKAVFMAQSGRPGPVLLDIPMNIQRAEIDASALPGFFDSQEYRDMRGGQHEPVDEQTLDRVIELMSAARRPVILAGGGVRSAGAAGELTALVEKTHIPVVASLMGLDALPQDNPAFFGMIGAYGNRYSNLTLANADFLLVLGSRLDTRQTGTRPETFARSARKVHVDIDPLELGAKVEVDIAVKADAREFLEQLNGKLAGYKAGDLADWYTIINGYRSRYAVETAEKSPGIDPNAFMELLSAHCGAQDVICLDVGQNQMWAAQSFRLREGQRMLIAGGMGAMGFALPAGIGAVGASPGSRAIVISGDGGLQLNIQELDTIATRQLPVKIFIMNNACLGMVRQFQDMYFEGRRQSTVKGYSCPDLAAISEAYRIPARSISDMADADAMIARVLSDSSPVVVDVKLSLDTTVNPKLMVNKPIEDMSPHLSREELERNMQIKLTD